MGAGSREELAPRALGALSALAAGGWLTASGVLQQTGVELLPSAEEHVDHWLAHGAVAATCVLLYVAASAVYVVQRDAAGSLGRDVFALLAFTLVATACAATAVIGSSFAFGVGTEVYAWSHRTQEVLLLAALGAMGVFGGVVARARRLPGGAGLLVLLGAAVSGVSVVPLGVAWLWLAAGLLAPAPAAPDAEPVEPSS